MSNPVAVAVKAANITSSTDHVGTTVTVTYRVTFTGNYDAMYVALNAATMGLPWYGDYATGSGSLVYCSHTESKILPNSLFVGTTAKPGAFEYIATFTPITPDRLDLSPLSRPPVCEFGGTDLTEVRRIDTNGKPMVNSTGDFYEGLPEFYVPGFEVALMYNVASNPIATISGYSWSTNNAGWYGQAKYSGAIGKITASPTWETYQGVLIKFWRVTVPVRFRTDGAGWSFQPFDYGYRIIKSGKAQNWTDLTTGVYGPVFLDGSGNALNSDGSTKPNPAVIFPAASGGTPAGYQVLSGRDWNAANFPNPFT